jgi:hypothetical protein
MDLHTVDEEGSRNPVGWMFSEVDSRYEVIMDIFRLSKVLMGLCLANAMPVT